MAARTWVGVAAGLGVCALLADTGPARGQPPGPSGRAPDPEKFWSIGVKMSGGTDTIRFDTMPPEKRGFLRMIAEKNGMPPFPETGEWTKDQFMAQFNRAMQMKAANAGLPPGAPGVGPDGQPSPGGPGGPGRSFGGPGGRGPRTYSPEDIARSFKSYDTDGDGRLSYDEASSKAKPYFKTVDANNDGYVDLQEYTVYRQMREQNEQAMAAASAGGAAPPSPYGGGWSPGSYVAGPAPSASTVSRDAKAEPPPPAVYRYGKMPKEAPSWFTELDTDKDGQIGFYEWRKAGRPTAEFAEMDLNNDGFVTAEEWMRLQRLTVARAKEADLVAAAADGPSAAAETAVARSSDSSSRGKWGGGSSSGKDEKKDKKDDKEKKKDEERSKSRFSFFKK